MRKLWSILLLLIGSTAALADPVWVPPKGTFQTAFSFTFANWDQFIQTGDQSVALPGEIDQFEFTLLSEYVPMENLSFDLQVPIVVTQKKFVFLETDFDGQIVGVTLGSGGQARDVDTNRGIGDVVLGSRYMFFDKVVSLGVRPYLKLPGTYESGDVVNAPGDGQTDLGLALLFGSYLEQIRSYIRSSFALVYRSGEPNNQMELMIEPGVNITKNISARLLYQYTEQFGGEDIAYYGSSNFYPAADEDSHRFGVGLAYRTGNHVDFFSMFQFTAAGRNTANTKALTVGLNLSF